MTTKDKLIASGMDAAEAERIAAVVDAEELAQSEAGAPMGGGAAEERAAETGKAEESAGEARAEEREQAAEELAEEATEEAAEEAAEAEEADAAEKTADDAQEAGPDVDALIANLMAAELRACALECGVDAKRMGALIRLADTSAIEPAAEDLHEQVMAAVKAALKEVPELARTGASSGALGSHARTGTGNGDIAAKFRSGF